MRKRTNKTIYTISQKPLFEIDEENIHLGCEALVASARQYLSLLNPVRHEGAPYNIHNWCEQINNYINDYV